MERKPGQRRVIRKAESSEILCAEIPAQQKNYLSQLAFQGDPVAKSR